MGDDDEEAASAQPRKNSSPKHVHLRAVPPGWEVLASAAIALTPISAYLGFVVAYSTKEEAAAGELGNGSAESCVTFAWVLWLFVVFGSVGNHLWGAFYLQPSGAWMLVDRLGIIAAATGGIYPAVGGGATAIGHAFAESWTLASSGLALALVTGYCTGEDRRCSLVRALHMAANALQPAFSVAGLLVGAFLIEGGYCGGAVKHSRRALVMLVVKALTILPPYVGCNMLAKCGFLSNTLWHASLCVFAFLVSLDIAENEMEAARKGASMFAPSWAGGGVLPESLSLGALPVLAASALVTLLATGLAWAAGGRGRGVEFDPSWWKAEDEWVPKGRPGLDQWPARHGSLFAEDGRCFFRDDREAAAEAEEESADDESSSSPPSSEEEDARRL